MSPTLFTPTTLLSSVTLLAEKSSASSPIVSFISTADVADSAIEKKAEAMKYVEKGSRGVGGV